MIHEMRLDPIQFDEVYSGLKLVESRLNDEKRRQLHIGDTIKFYKRPDCVKEVEVRVVELHHYKNIKELVDSTPLEYWGPRFKNKQALRDAKWHYNSDEIEKYGLLAIYIKRI
jgi:ASC-1-like (ASCH) protein